MSFHQNRLATMIGKKIGHYRVLEELGRGAVGVVYKAQDTHLDRTVALKFLPQSTAGDSTDRARLVQEARAASSINHPNVCTIYGFEKDQNGREFIVMEYVDGVTLREKLRSVGGRHLQLLSLKDAVTLAIQICEGLKEAHSKGIVHRDMKPENIMVNNRNQVKVLDFGIAKFKGSAQLTQTGGTVGTLAYMSPEQIQGAGVDTRSDVFSFGVMFYEMLTGRLPFRGDHAAGVMYSILNDEPEPPSKFLANTSPELLHILSSALEKDPNDRYQTVNELVLDLRRMTEESGTVPLSVPLKNRYGRRSLWKKNRSGAMAAMGIIGGLAIAVVVWLVMFNETFSLGPADLVVVADFQNSTNDKVFDHSLTEAMHVSLRQSAHINMLSADRVASAFERMQIAKDHQLDEPTALGVAQRVGVRAVLAGEISRLGPVYLLSCRIIDAVTGDLVELVHREAATVGEVLPEMDQLCGDVRNALGESLREISTYSMPLEEVTTPSLQALELYSQGERLEANGNYQGAAELKEQALVIDSLFIGAISDLSYIHRKLGNDNLALHYHRRVLPLLSRATERERFSILARYYGPNFEIDFEKALQNAQQCVARYPRDPDAHVDLGYLAMTLGQTETVLQANHRARELGTQFAGTSYNNSGVALALAGRADEALESLREAKRLRPTFYATDSYIARVYWMKEQLDSTEQTLQAIIRVSDPARKINTYIQLTSLYFFMGRLRHASETCSEARGFCASLNRLPDEAYFHYLAGEIALRQADRRKYLEELKAAESMTAGAFPELPLIGASFAANDFLQDADRIAKRILSMKSNDPYFIKRRRDYFHLVQGEILLAKRNPGSALDEFRTVGRLHAGDPLYLLAQSGIGRCRAAMNDTAAINTFNELLDRRGEVVVSYMLTARSFGFWVRTLWPEIHLELGKLYVGLQRTPQAETHFRAALRCWATADEEDMKVNEARELLEQLEGVR